MIGIKKIKIRNPALTRTVYNFDTYKFVQRMEAQGFARTRAEGIMNSLMEVVNESRENLKKSAVKKTDFEKAMYVSKVELAHLNSDVSLLEKNEFSTLRADIARLYSLAAKLPQKVYEESIRISSAVKMDISINKGRIRDEQASQEMKIRETISKIDTEVSQFKTLMRTVQWELFKTLFPLFCAGGALFFSYLRFLK
jgi:hypothetical protein